MKRVSFILLVLTLSIATIACSKKNDDGKDQMKTKVDVTFHVVNKDKEDIPSVEINGHKQGDTEEVLKKIGVTDDHGKVAWKDVEVGTYEITVRNADYAQSKTIDIKESDDKKTIEIVWSK